MTVLFLSKALLFKLLPHDDYHASANGTRFGPKRPAAADMEGNGEFDFLGDF